MNVSQRERIIWRIGELIEKNKEELGLLESLNNGKTYLEPCAAIFLHRGHLLLLRGLDAERFTARPSPVDGKYLNYTLREPVGVVGMITPWNYPMLLAAWKVAPALATGCSMVIKPSELTPITTFKLAEYCLEAGVPEGVGQCGDRLRPYCGRFARRHMDVDKIGLHGQHSHGARVVEGLRRKQT